MNDIRGGNYPYGVDNNKIFGAAYWTPSGRLGGPPEVGLRDQFYSFINDFYKIASSIAVWRSAFGLFFLLLHSTYLYLYMILLYDLILREA